MAEFSECLGLEDEGAADFRGDLVYDDQTGKTFVRETHTRPFTGRGPQIWEYPVVEYLQRGDFAGPLRHIIGDTPVDDDLGRNLVAQRVLKRVSG